MHTFRTNGALGALLDEYEKALNEFKAVIRAGYGYAYAIQKLQGEKPVAYPPIQENTVASYLANIDAMFQYNERLFEAHPNLKLEEYDHDKKMLVSWGQSYDPEQLLEHAIVHILRHRRQIERFLLGMRGRLPS